MRKFAANYLVSDTGVFLKNGMVIARADGVIEQYIDTKGDLREVEQLSFHNGILIAGFSFTRNKTSSPNLLSDNPFWSMVLQLAGGFEQLLIQDYMEMGKKLQVQFPRMKIPAIMNEITAALLSEGGFEKQTNPGLYLFTGVDLVNLHFTPKSRLMKISV